MKIFSTALALAACLMLAMTAVAGERCLRFQMDGTILHWPNMDAPVVSIWEPKPWAALPALGWLCRVWAQREFECLFNYKPMFTK